MNKKIKGVWIVTTVISLFAIVVGTYYSIRTKEQAVNSNAAADVSLVFNTPSLNSNINTTLTPKLTINPTTNQVTAVEVYLTFDSSKVMINSITKAAKFGTILKAPVIDNNAGTANFILGINGGVGITPIPVTTVSDVVTINLTTKGVVGDTTINLATNSRVAAKGIDTSVLGTLGQMVIHIANSATPSPTIAPTANPSPSSYPAWDVNEDGYVGILDINLIVTDYDSTNPINPRTDVNRDGIVGILDIGKVVDHFDEYTN